MEVSCCEVELLFAVEWFVNCDRMDFGEVVILAEVWRVSEG